MSIQDAFVEAYVETIKFLQSKGKKVIFAIDVPELGMDLKSCFKRLVNISNRDVANCTNDRTIMDARQKEYRELIVKIQQKVPNLLIYDPTSAFCDENKCYGKRDGIALYLDANHLNIEGAKVLGQDFKKWAIEHKIINGL